MVSLNAEKRDAFLTFGQSAERIALRRVRQRRGGSPVLELTIDGHG